MDEITVILSLKQWILKNGLNAFGSVDVILIHRHHTLINNKALSPFHTIRIHNRYPDLLIKLSNGLLIAIEAKGEKDLIKAISQGLAYKKGVDDVYIAAPLNIIDDQIKDLTKTYGLGLIGVDNKKNVQILIHPLPSPLDSQEYALVKASISLNLRVSDSLQLNHPGNYLMVAAGLKSILNNTKQNISLSKLERLLIPYLGNKTTRAITGAMKLNLIIQGHNGLQLSKYGRLLHKSITELYTLFISHKGSKNRFSSKKLYEIDAELNIYFRYILLQLPEVQLIIDSLDELKKTGKHIVTATELGKECLKLNEVLAEQFVLSVSLDSIIGNDLKYEDLHSYFRYVLKSLLKHTRIVDGTLYSKMAEKNEEKDTWELLI